MACRVLVVDDEPDYRFLVRLALRRDADFRVVGEASSGPEGIDAAARLQPDVVLLDLVMPGVDGLASLPLLREAAPGAAIVATSASRDSEVVPLLRAGGSLGHLSKAVPPGRLPDELRLLFGVLSRVGTAVDSARARLVGEPPSAAAARRFVDETLGRWNFNDAFETVTLLTSELVTNAILHARSDFEISVLLMDDRLRIEVSDSSPAVIHRRAAGDDELSGRGMFLVEAMAEAWGVEPRPWGKIVWFELPRPTGEPLN